MNVSRYGAPCVESDSVVFIANTLGLMFPNAFVSTSLNVMLRVVASSYSSVNVAVFVVANVNHPLCKCVIKCFYRVYACNDDFARYGLIFRRYNVFDC